MLRFAPWKIIITLGVVLFGFLFTLPNFLPEGVRNQLPGFMPSQTINLGLDLRGGSYLELEVDSRDLMTNRLRILSRDIQQSLIKRPGNVKFSNRHVTKEAVRFSVIDIEQMDEAIRRVKELSAPVGGVGGPQSLTVTSQGSVVSVSFSEAQMEMLGVEAMSKSIEVVRRRVDSSGTTEPNIQRQGVDRIVLEVPGLDDPTELLDLIQRAGVMTINLVDEAADKAVFTVDQPRRGQILRADATEPSLTYVVDEDPIITGADFSTASQSFDERGNPQINFTLNTKGARAFGKFTAENVGNTFAIVLDGKVISAATVQSPIMSGSGRITGRFSITEANNIASILEAGELPAKLEPRQKRVVGAGLGQDSIEAGTRASLLGLALVAVFMVLVYMLWGAFAVTSLTANILILFGALSGLGATLTLPGIAGIILTIGMAVDANVLVFERIREEARNGRSPMTAVDIGYKQAQSSILDANVTTLIAAGVLYAVGSGPVKGFAVTLGLGVMSSVFTAFVLTRLMMATWLRVARPKSLNV